MKVVFLFLLTTIALTSFAQQYRMPGEDLEHEGTWLQWPHNNLYGPFYQGDVEAGWVTMTDALQTGEMVHIIAYDEAHKTHIINELNTNGVPLTNVDFYVFQNDDVWVRDNGPIFVYDESDNLTILDWGFNGWGNDAPYSLCDVIPQSVSTAIGVPRIDLSAMVLEGGAIEHDGHGTMMATRSCIVHSSRNPNLTEAQIEDYMSTYLGFEKFIWLDGVYGQDITDHHIDGFVKFANDSTIVTMNATDLDYWLVTPAEVQQIYNATNVNNDPYTIVTVPMTANNVVTVYGNDLGFKGSYCNYYIGNDAVIVPVYGDPNDTVALNIIQGIYPNRTVVGMNVQNLYEYGGMAHCVTQQQPIELPTASLIEVNQDDESVIIYPNPASDEFYIDLKDVSGEVEIQIFDAVGKLVYENINMNTIGSTHKQVDIRGFEDGVYICVISSPGKLVSKRLIVKNK